MEISKKLKEKALNVLRYEGILTLPKEIENTGFFVADGIDKSVLGHGVVVFEGKEYKIGTRKN